jgi:excisionase family DNA binding protein
MTVVNDGGYWMTVRDVAVAIRKSEPTVRRAVRRGDLVAHVFGERGYLIAPADFAEFIAKSRKGADAAGGAAGSNEDLARAG